MQALGYVPVSADLDPSGTGVLDAYGNPVPVPVINPAAGPVQIDPRMLDPTRYWLLGQIEWWFSVDNLCRDLFLRQSVSGCSVSGQSWFCAKCPADPVVSLSQMDTSGWIPISLIASFNRIKNLTSDIKIVVECMRMTPLLEVSPKDRFVRLAQTWPQWVLPNAQTNEDVKKDFEEASNPSAGSKTGEAEPAAATAEKSTAQQEESASQSNEDKQAGSADVPEPQVNGDVAEEETGAREEASEPASEHQNESAVKASPPPRRGSPPGEPVSCTRRIDLGTLSLTTRLPQQRRMPYLPRRLSHSPSSTLPSRPS